MKTDELQALAQGFGRRVLPWEGWERALFVMGTYPTDLPDVRKSASRLYLVGPPGHEPPTRVLRRVMRGQHEWLLVPHLAAMELESLSLAMATRPLPNRGKFFNLMVIHYARLEDGSSRGTFGFAHQPQMDESAAPQYLDDVAWVREALAQLGACRLP